MGLEKNKVGFDLERGEEITIKAVVNPITDKLELIVTSNKYDRGMLAKTIFIDGAKLLWE